MQLVFFDKRGYMITSHGRKILEKDSKGIYYPWKDLSFLNDTQFPILSKNDHSIFELTIQTVIFLSIYLSFIACFLL